MTIAQHILSNHPFAALVLAGLILSALGCAVQCVRGMIGRKGNTVLRKLTHISKAE